MLLAALAVAPWTLNRVREEQPRSIGLTHPPVPSSVAELEGVLITGRTAPPGSGPAYAFLRVRAGGEERLWLDSGVVAATGGSPARWKVVADVQLPPRASGRVLVMHGCWRAGRLDPTVVAVARADTAEVLTGVERAWKADLRRRRLVPITPIGVRCDNEAYGL